MQDIFLTKTAELADVVLPGSASWCEAEGTVTNSERRVQLVRKALDPPGDARDDIEHPARRRRRPRPRLALRRRAEDVWNELRSLSPMHAGMSYARLEELGGIQWPCYSEDRLEPSYLHGRLWADDPDDRGRPAPFSVVIDEPPVDELDERVPAAPHHRPPARLVQHRRAVGRLPQPDCASARRSTSRRRTPTALGIDDGEIGPRQSRARGAVEAPVAHRSRRCGPAWCS